MTPYREGFFEGQDGLWLYRRTWGEGERGTIVLVHGFGDHSGRFRFLVRLLTKQGFRVEGFDCRGHGRSAGERGHVDDFQVYVDDLDVLLSQLYEREEVSGPVLLLGHSQGAHIVLRYGMMHGHKPVEGVIVSSPFLGLNAQLPIGRTVAACVSSRLWPTLSQSVGIDVGDLSHDADILSETSRDPLYGRSATSRWFTATLKAFEDTFQNSHRFDLPLFMQQAGDERIVDKHAAIRFFEECGSVDRKRVEYSGLFHEIYNETPARREPVFEDLTGWLEQRWQA